MKLSDQVCNLELSKRLKELGVEQESLFYWNVYDKKCKQKVKHELTYKKRVPGLFCDCKNYSAFTVAELGEMLPGYIVSGKISDYYLDISVEGQCRRWWYSYRNSDHDVLNQENDLSEADCRAKMLIWLIENRKVIL
jgi:hypothetical protein